MSSARHGWASGRSDEFCSPWKEPEEPDLAFMCCVTFSKSLSLSRPLVQSKGSEVLLAMLVVKGHQLSSAWVLVHSM